MKPEIFLIFSFFCYIYRLSTASKRMNINNTVQEKLGRDRMGENPFLAVR